MSKRTDGEASFEDTDKVEDAPNDAAIDETDGSAKNDQITDRKTEKIGKEKKWTCEDTPLWRIFVNSYIDREKKLEIADKLNRRKPAVLPKLPNVVSSENVPFDVYSCFPFNASNLEERSRLPNKRNRQEKIRLWKSMRNDPEVDMGSFLPVTLPEVTHTDSEKWPSTWPCVNRDLAGEIRNLEKLRKRRAKGLLPCQEDTDSESNLDEPKDDFADRKELGHARVPISCPSVKKMFLVDRSSGEKPGLVDGDYVLFFFNKNDKEKSSQRVYADVCLRGMKGMHLSELRDERDRQKTWKFCFYQAVVALLAKTQLRYKFAWSVNIDYIFDHAWMLFVHMGSINVKERICLDDVVVYNYKYSIELELVHEMKEAPVITGAGWDYAEKEFEKSLKYERPELMKTRESVGWEKSKIGKSKPVNEATREIEKWFDELPLVYRNCILRTPKFSLAFWKDETFWYLYNPYRCDQFGLFHDEGFASIMKFCSKTSLKRHLMILMLRAYSYQPDDSLKLFSLKNSSSMETGNEPVEEIDQETTNTNSDEKNRLDETVEDHPKNAFTIQIYQMIYNCAKIHNVKLLQRKPAKPKMEKVRKKQIDDCLDLWMPKNPCANDSFENVNYPRNANDDDDWDDAEAEKASWLKVSGVKWARFSKSVKDRKVKEPMKAQLRWHHFYVEEPLKLFSLWGEIHPTGHMFASENRGKQARACYVVCAGMTRIQAPEYWSPKTLDAIVMCGDRYYTLNKRTAIIDDQKKGQNYDLGKHFKIGETLFEVEILEDVCGRLYDKNGRNLWKILEQTFLKHHFGILTCESSCLGVFKFCGAYCMIDVNSVGPPLFQYGDGVSYLIRATTYREFVRVLVQTIGSNECNRFILNPIIINKMIDLGTTDLHDTLGKVVLRKLDCPYEDDGKGSKKGKSKDLDQQKSTINKVSCRNSNYRN